MGYLLRWFHKTSLLQYVRPKVSLTYFESHILLEEGHS